MPVERELKLVAPREDLIRLERSPVLAGRGSAPERQEQLDSTYFDTADARLARRDLALRVRRTNGRYVQTLKRGGGVVRGEWETTLDGAQPEPGPLFVMAGEEDLVDLDVAELRPVLTTRVERRLQEIRIDGHRGEHRIEVALDLGELEADERRQPVAELELELLEGEPAALYELALELGREVPLRLETLSKAARGEMLRTGLAPPWRKSLKVDLGDAETVDDAMAAIFGACYEHWLANQAAAIDGRDSEGVHQLRVALRRLRSALVLFKQALPPDRLSTLKDESRTVVKGLGRARDLDVISEQLVRPLCQARPDDRALEALAARLDAARQATYAADVRPGLTAASYTLFTLDFGGWVAGRGWRDTASEISTVQEGAITDFARAMLDQRLKTVRKRGRGFADLDAMQRHELRIAIKKLRYALDFTGSLFPRKRVKAMLKTLGDLQDGLGAANDLALAGEQLRGIAGRARGTEARRVAEASGFVLGWHAAAIDGASKELKSLWRAFKAEPPPWRTG